MKFLIVEDNSTIAETICIAFEMRWPDAQTMTTDSGKKAAEIAEQQQPDLIVLDLGLPDMDGFEVLKEIRSFSMIPILILTARDNESDIVKCLERGADDYVVKPFRQLELMSRAQAVMRRHHVTSSFIPPSYGNLRFGHSLTTLFIGDKQVNLTSTEGIILSHLIRNAGKVVTLSSISEVIWGADYAGSQEAVRVYIRRIRKKIETDPNHPKIICTHPGTGYSLQQTDS